MSTTSHIINIGPSALDGKPIALLAKVGGNGKVKGSKGGKVLGFAVVSLALVEQVLAPEHKDIHGGHMGGVYLRAIKTTIDSVCDDACKLKALRKCYAQHNAQSTTEVVAMIRAADDGTWRDTGPRLDTLRAMMALGDMGAGDYWRSMISGSVAAISPSVWESVVTVLSAAGVKPLAYVEAWRDRPDLRDTHMASCMTIDDAREARALGWRVFLSAPAEAIGNTMPEGFIMCPGSKYHVNAGRKLAKCNSCGLCDGARDGDKRPSIVNIRHGNGDSSRLASLIRRGELAAIITNARGRMVGAYVPQ